MTGRTGKGTGPRPHTWLAGTDPVRHRQYDAWHKARAQAHYRGEQYLITFEDWVALWGNNWSRRGRGADCLMLMKRDWQQPWTKQNAELVDRPTFHKRQHQIKIQRQDQKEQQ